MGLAKLGRLLLDKLGREISKIGKPRMSSVQVIPVHWQSFFDSSLESYPRPSKPDNNLFYFILSDIKSGLFDNVESVPCRLNKIGLCGSESFGI